MTPTDWILATALLPLLVCSAIFSCSETVLFGLSQSDRLWLRRERASVAAIVDHLLLDPRQLLITILLVNMTVNTLYFVTTSVMLIRVSESWVVSTLASIITLIMLILLGEILPKLAANAARRRLVGVCVTLIRPVHLLLAPVRILLDRTVVTPAARLIGGGEASGLSVGEIDEALESASRSGLVDERGRGVLARVVRLGALRVRDVMTPRVDLVAVPVQASRSLVATVAGRAGLTRLVVHRGDFDDIEGFLNVRSFLLDPRGDRTPLADHCRPALVVPEVATVQQLLDLFRQRGRQIAVVVDEFGGTEGVVSLEDAVEEIVGDIQAPGEAPIPPPQPTADGRWRVSGEMPAVEFARVFGLVLGPDAPATAGGVTLEQLGHEPRQGNRVVIDGMTVEVAFVQRGRIRELIVDRAPESEP
ncbi:MAG: HlyC/CorC family transporter [Phycisphaeraceae bacterium]|nr:HlyC/CorC family transporter [Phycisphaeraceae bacterium]